MKTHKCSVLSILSVDSTDLLIVVYDQDKGPCIFSVSFEELKYMVPDLTGDIVHDHRPLRDAVERVIRARALPSFSARTYFVIHWTDEALDQIDDAVTSPNGVAVSSALL